jgi:hypothetical protein
MRQIRNTAKMETLGFDSKTKSFAANGKAEDGGEDLAELQGGEATSLRAVATRMKHLSQDVADIKFASNKVCRGRCRGRRSRVGRDSSCSHASSWRELRWYGSFLGKRRSQKFLSIPIMIGQVAVLFVERLAEVWCCWVVGHCIETWSSTQAPVALSSAEAQHYAMVEATTRAKGIRQMLSELGIGSVVFGFVGG